MERGREKERGMGEMGRWGGGEKTDKGEREEEMGGGVRERGGEGIGF